MLTIQGGDIVALLVFIDYCNIHVATYISQLSYSCAVCLYYVSRMKSFVTNEVQ